MVKSISKDVRLYLYVPKIYFDWTSSAAKSMGMCADILLHRIRCRYHCGIKQLWPSPKHLEGMCGKGLKDRGLLDTNSMDIYHCTYYGNLIGKEMKKDFLRYIQHFIFIFFFQMDEKSLLTFLIKMTKERRTGQMRLRKRKATRLV